MRIGYDLRGDILFIDLGTTDEIKARRTGGKHLDTGKAYVDLAADGTILSIEIQDASTRYPREALEALNAYPDEPLSLAQAAHVCGIDAEALKKAAQDGRLVAKKIGRNWTTTTGAALAYKAARKHAGPGSVAVEVAPVAAPTPRKATRRAATQAIAEPAAGTTAKAPRARKKPTA